MLNMRTELEITIKVKELVYIKFFIPLPILITTFMSLSPLCQNLNLVKITYYINPFFFVNVVIS